MKSYNSCAHTDTKNNSISRARTKGRRGRCQQRRCCGFHAIGRKERRYLRTAGHRDISAAIDSGDNGDDVGGNANENGSLLLFDRRERQNHPVGRWWRVLQQRHFHFHRPVGCTYVMVVALYGETALMTCSSGKVVRVVVLIEGTTTNGVIRTFFWSIISGMV